MTMQLIVVNAQQQKQMISLTKGEQVVVAKGDTIRLLSKMDIKTLRKGNDLIIKNAKGEEFVLKDFYAKAEKSQEVKTLSWDDPLGDEKELFSEEYSESIKVAANGSDVTSDATTQGGSANNPSSTGGENVAAGSEGDRSPAAIAAALLGLGGVAGAVALANSGGSNNNRPAVVKNSVGAVADSNGDTNTVAENAANDTVVGITALATDPDTGDNVTYSLTNDAGGRFKINSSTGIVSVADGTLLNYEAATSHTITVKATSSDGSSSTANMTITITNVDEFDVGAISDNNASANTVAENAATNTLVGITALATDADAGDNVTYSLTNDAGGRFKINSSTGIVSVADGTLLNFETGISHTITVKATSTDGSSKTANMTIAVTNVNEAPTVANIIPDQSSGWTKDSAGSFTFDANTFDDVDAGDTLTYTATLEGGADLSTIGLSFDSGSRTISGTPNAVGTYNVVVTATDTGGLNVSDTFALAVGAGATAPVLLGGNLDNLANLDVRSQIVLQFDQNISLADGQIRIMDDMGTNGWTVTNTTTLESKQDVTDNDVVITITGGVVTGLTVGGVDYTVLGATGIALADLQASVTLSGDKLIITPAGNDNASNTDWDFDWDFGANYHVELDAGVVKNMAGTLGNAAVNDSTTVNFTTVTPVGNATGAASQDINSDGTLNAGYIWHHAHAGDGGVGGPLGYSLDFSLGTGSHALVFQSNGGNSQTSTIAGNINATKFGLDDLIYNDNLGNLNLATTEGTKGALWSGSGNTLQRFLNNSDGVGSNAEIHFTDYANTGFTAVTNLGGGDNQFEAGPTITPPDPVGHWNANVIVFG